MDSADEAKRDLEQLVQALVDAQSDTEAFVALHGDEVVLVNLAGRRVLGTRELEQAMAVGLSTSLAQVTTTLAIDDIRFIRPDVAVVSCTKRIHDGRADRDELGDVPPTATFTLVATHESSGWTVAVAQTTPRLV